MQWLHVLSTIYITLSIVSTVIVIIDLFRNPSHMKIMNIVWPTTTLYAGPVGLWAYFSLTRKEKDDKSRWQQVLGSTSHCAAGCTIGDMIGVPIVFLSGLTIFGSKLFADYTVEFILAYILGIGFQLFAILPMHEDIGFRKGLKQAIKADTWSLVAFEVGMFGWMALIHYVFFTEPPKPTELSFWFLMQIAMILGFLTSYPANWYLVKKGIKHGM